MNRHHIKQILSSIHIDVVIELRLFNGFSDERFTCKVNDRLAARKRASERIRVEESALDEGSP